MRSELLRIASPCQLESRVSEAQFAQTIVWLLRIQAVLAGLVGLVWFLLVDQQHALAALAGGGIGILLSAAVALRMAMSVGAEHEQIVRGFYRAMMLKLVLAAFLFVVVARWFAPWFGPVLTGYCVTLVAYWGALWRTQWQMTKKQ